MFVSGVGGTGKSFLIKTVRALVSKLWEEETRSTLCAVTAPTGLAAFNVGGVTIHRLLQLPIEHEGRGAGYWKLAKETLKIMRTSLSKLKLLIIDEVSMVSSLNLAYIHLRLDEIFARDEWFGGVNVLQLPPVNGAAVFEKCFHALHQFLHQGRQLIRRGASMNCRGDRSRWRCRRHDIGVRPRDTADRLYAWARRSDVGFHLQGSSDRMVEGGGAALTNTKHNLGLLQVCL